MSYYLERIQRGVDFVEARLDEEIALMDVARAAGISQSEKNNLGDRLPQVWAAFLPCLGAIEHRVDGY